MSGERRTGIYGDYTAVASTRIDMPSHHCAGISTVVRVAFTGLTLLVLAGCSKDTPTAPTPPPVAACQANNTAEVSFRNRSAASTYTVQWDGATLTTLAPGQDSQTYVVAAGVQHTVRFFLANSNSLACNAAFPILAACSNMFYQCNLP